MTWTIKLDTFSGLATIYDGHTVVAQEVAPQYAEQIVEAVNQQSEGKAWAAERERTFQWPTYEPPCECDKCQHPEMFE